MFKDYLFFGRAVVFLCLLKVKGKATEIGAIKDLRPCEVPVANVLDFSSDYPVKERVHEGSF
jgi:hypothetical protein